MARPRKPSAALQSLDECNQAIQDLLVATLTREGLQACRDLDVAKAQKAYEEDIDAQLKLERDLMAQLQQYYVTHLAEIEKNGKRSIQLANGLMGRRKSPASLRPKNKTFTWASIRVLLKAAFGNRYFHDPKEPEIDKDALKRDLTDEQLGQYGLKLHQDEEFYVEPARLPEAQ